MSCIMENGRLQNDLGAEFIVAHAEFIIAKTRWQISSRQPSSSSVTTQRTKCSKTRVVIMKQKYKAPPHMDPLEDYQPHMLLPLLSVRTKKV